MIWAKAVILCHSMKEKRWVNFRVVFSDWATPKSTEQSSNNRVTRKEGRRGKSMMENTHYVINNG